MSKCHISQFLLLILNHSSCENCQIFFIILYKWCGSRSNCISDKTSSICLCIFYLEWKWKTQNVFSFFANFFSPFFRIVLPITPNSESDEGTGTSSSASVVVLCNNSTTTVKKEEDEDHRATTTFRTDAEDAFEALIRSSSRANSRTAVKSEPKTEFVIDSVADDRGMAQDYSG